LAERSKKVSELGDPVLELDETVVQFGHELASLVGGQQEG
jgi:hypothetical protein